MATQRRFLDELTRCNSSVASWYHMSVRTYKTLKVLTQLTGAAAGIYAMSLGASPMAALTLVAVIIAGPEIIEVMISEQDPPD